MTGIAPFMQTLGNLIAAGESLTLEFKSSFDKAALESLVAFANAQGGTVLVGISDAGEVRGTTLGKETLNEWLVQIKSATSPSIIPDLQAHQINGKTIVARCKMQDARYNKRQGTRHKAQDDGDLNRATVFALT